MTVDKRGEKQIWGDAEEIELKKVTAKKDPSVKEVELDKEAEQKRCQWNCAYSWRNKVRGEIFFGSVEGGIHCWKNRRNQIISWCRRDRINKMVAEEINVLVYETEISVAIIPNDEIKEMAESMLRKHKREWRISKLVWNITIFVAWKS